MMLDRIGTIGSTQGVKARPRPARKNQPNVVRRLPERMRAANQSCSETKPAEPVALPTVGLLLALTAAELPLAPDPGAPEPAALEAGGPEPAAAPVSEGRLTVISLV